MFKRSDKFLSRLERVAVEMAFDLLSIETDHQDVQWTLLNSDCLSSLYDGMDGDSLTEYLDWLMSLATDRLERI